MEHSSTLPLVELETCLALFDFKILAISLGSDDTSIMFFGQGHSSREVLPVSVEDVQGQVIKVREGWSVFGGDDQHGFYASGFPFVVEDGKDG